MNSPASAAPYYPTASARQTPYPDLLRLHNPGRCSASGAPTAVRGARGLRFPLSGSGAPGREHLAMMRPPPVRQKG